MYTLHYISTIQMLYYGNDEEFPCWVINTGKTVEISHYVKELARCYDAVKIPHCLTVRHSTEMVQKGRGKDY